MSRRCRSRRAFLRTGAAAVAAVGVAGCLGDAPACGDETTVLFRSRLSGFYVSYPLEAGLLDERVNTAEPAERFAGRARDRGYAVEYYESELRERDEAELQIEVYGDDLSRDDVEDLVAASEMPESTSITENAASPIQRGSQLRLPWEPGFIEGRAAFLAENAPTVDVDPPQWGALSDRRAALVEPADDLTVDWLRSALGLRSVLRVELLGIDVSGDALKDQRASNVGDWDAVDDRSDDTETTHDAGDVSLDESGAVDTGMSIRSVLKGLYDFDRDPSSLVDRARFRITLNGRLLEERPPTRAERDFVETYVEYVESDPFDESTGPEEPSPPTLRVTGLDGRRALSVATALRWPTAVQFGVAAERC
ncbi:hypothetical protein [Halomicrobium urmianum]|uniref:hypothetical protein n=1 Tax=Halomicrobium urmianum TaxID=1586233 RepID=UPI001CD9FE83|nr:hypothetical protein [Halomicrobium urmianum]